MILCLALAGVLAGCGSEEPGRNVILISIDTLRSDHLGCYGYGLDTSPHLDAFREDAVLFRQAIAHAPSTLMSHASLLTSLIPQHHGASHGHGIALPGEVLTLAEVLRDGGWRTASFNSGGQLDAVYGLDQGFEIYDDQSHGPFSEVVGKAQRWLEEHGDEPFFLFLHTYEVHHPYTPEPGLLELFESGYDGPLPRDISIELLQRINAGKLLIDREDLAHIVHAYDAEIRSMDRTLGQFLASLRERGLYDDTLIIFTSDHGEEFFERGRVGWHAHTLFDELLRVPLVVKYPHSAHAGAEVRQQVRLTDVAPTVLKTVGVPVPDAFEGSGLTSLVTAGSRALAWRRDQGRPAVSQLDVKDRRHLVSLRLAGWKWYRGLLFDLENDPGEKVDLAAERPDRAEQLRSLLDEIVRSRPELAGEAINPDSDTLERLRALGYVE